MINDFLIISCIGDNDKLGLRINKDFFIHRFINKKTKNEELLSDLLSFLKSQNVSLDKNFSVIVNQGPGSFSRIRISLAIAKGLEISKKIRLFGFNNEDLKQFDQKNIEELIKKNLTEKKLIKPIYLS